MKVVIFTGLRYELSFLLKSKKKKGFDISVERLCSVVMFRRRQTMFSEEQPSSTGADVYKLYLNFLDNFQ
jgi:hypothetical protein